MLEDREMKIWTATASYRSAKVGGCTASDGESGSLFSSQS